MRIGIDVRYLSHGLVGGVHTYVAQFVPALIEIARQHDIVLYADSKRAFELQDMPAHVRTRILPWRNPVSSIQHDLTLRYVMESDRIDVAHFPANYGFGPRGGKTVITLHDAINILPLREIVRGHAKKPRTIAMMTYLHLCSRAALRNAAMLLTVSEHAARTIAATSGYNLSRIVAVPHAPTSDLRRVTEPERLADVRSRHHMTRPFVIADALKNPATLVRAWRQLPDELRKQFQIVFFCRHSDPPAIVAEAVSEGIAALLLRPSREDLIALYSIAEAFVFPSWIEGFGIPVLEAMTCGAPVIASDRGAIPEVAGTAALLADAEDDAQFACHIERVLRHPEEATQLRLLGFRRAATFSWERTARAILDVYEQVQNTSHVASPAH